MITAYSPIGRRIVTLPREYTTIYYPGRRKITPPSKVERPSRINSNSKGRLIDIIC